MKDIRSLCLAARLRSTMWRWIRPARCSAASSVSRSPNWRKILQHRRLDRRRNTIHSRVECAQMRHRLWQLTRSGERGQANLPEPRKVSHADSGSEKGADACAELLLEGRADHLRERPIRVEL